MVGHHVTQGASGIEVASTLLHADGFGICDLNVINVAAVPDGLEDGVIEAEHENVLHCLFAEVVVNPIDLVLRQHCLNLPI